MIFSHIYIGDKSLDINKVTFNFQQRRLTFLSPVFVCNLTLGCLSCSSYFDAILSHLVAIGSSSAEPFIPWQTNVQNSAMRQTHAKRIRSIRGEVLSAQNPNLPPTSDMCIPREYWLCIFIALWVFHRCCYDLRDGNTLIEEDKLHITTGRETQNCWACSVHCMKGIQFRVVMVW